MPNFHAYGMTLCSNVQIPGLHPLSTDEDRQESIQVFWGLLPKWFLLTLAVTKSSPEYYLSPYEDEQGNPLLRVWKINQDKHFYFYYADETEFVIDCQGTEIWANWPENLTREDAATYLLGPIVGFILRLRGKVCLHASAVVINERVAVFIGRSGAGKSTTAAGFAQRGYPVLAEDVVTLIERDSTFQIQPAYPHIRLWDSSVQALYGTTAALPRLVPTHPTWDKRYLDLTQAGYQFQQNPLSLAALYYLNPRRDDLTCPRIEPMSAQEQLITLVTNTYTNYLLDKQQRAHEFEVLSRLVKYVPIRQITPHNDVSPLPQLLDLVLADFEGKVVSESPVTHA